MAQENIYYVVSETGFGGPGFRVAEKFLWKTTPVTKDLRQTIVCPGGQIATLKRRSSDQGELLKVTVRPEQSPSTPKARVALFAPKDRADFEKYFRAKETDFAVTDISPLSYALNALARSMQEGEDSSALDQLISTIDKQSRFPTQNREELILRITKRAQQGLPLKIGCFACLNMRCENRNNQPVYSVGQEENRLESPRISRRTQQILASLKESRFPVTWEFILADGDPEEIYSDWLIREDQGPAIQKYGNRIKVDKYWRDLEQQYAQQYAADFNSSLANIESLVGLDYVQKSVERRLAYFVDRVGLKKTPELKTICELTARRNIASYAAQGPIINQEYDCLVIADPDPQRLGMIQSLLCPQLPIWYPYPG